MESEAKYVIAGSFLIIGLLSLIVTLIWISRAGNQQHTDNYTVYFKNQSLEGLQKDTYVTMKGIRVGSVADYEISPRNIEEVKVTLRLDHKTPVKEDSRAVLKRNLLTGLATLDIVGSTQDSQLLSAVPPGEHYPVIPEGRSPFEKIAESLPKLLERIGESIDRIQRVLSEENINSISSSLQSLEATGKELVKSSAKADSVLTELGETLNSVEQTSAAIKALAKDADSSLADVSRESTAALREIRSGVQSLSKQTADTSVAIRTAARVFSQESTAVSQNINEAARKFSKTMESFEDPQRIIVGPREKALGPGEKLTK